MHYPSRFEDVLSVLNAEDAESPAVQVSELPCATVLVRLLVPPKKGLVPLSSDTLPITEWESSGLVKPKPKYTQRGYDTARCEPRQHELLLFKALVDRPARRMADAVRLVESGSGESTS